MKRRGLLRAVARVLAFVCMPASACFAQSPKEMHDIAIKMADQCAALKLLCRAAAIDKKYKQECDQYTVSLNAMSIRDLSSGHEKLEDGSFAGASRYANNVCDYDPALAAKKRDLLDAIKKAQLAATPPAQPQVPAQPQAQSQPQPQVPAQPQPQAQPQPDISREKLAEAERAFDSGDFDAAATAARLVTDKSLQDRANAVLQKISNYNNAMQDGRQKENGRDPSGALRSFRVAAGISKRGPGDPLGHIRNLETQLAGGGHPPLPPPPPKGAEAAAPFIAQAKQAEGRNLGEALRLYQAALRVDPGNAEATAASLRVQVLINSDPGEQAKVLADAIRAFYSFSYAEAEDGLTSYLSSTTAKYKGAAHFYLGASRLSRHILESSEKKAQEVAKSEDVQRPFKDARTACYRPVAKFLSPVVLSAWNLSPSGAACTR